MPKQAPQKILHSSRQNPPKITGAGKLKDMQGGFHQQILNHVTSQSAPKKEVISTDRGVLANVLQGLTRAKLTLLSGQISAGLAKSCRFLVNYSPFFGGGGLLTIPLQCCW